MKKLTQILVFFCILSFRTTAQAQVDSIRSLGLRFGYDLSGLALLAINPDKVETEVSADLGVLPRVFLAGEIGRGAYSFGTPDADFDFESKGSFIKLGVDYDLFNKYSDVITIGVRFSQSRYKYTLSNIPIEPNYYNTSGYIKNYPEETVNSSFLTFNLGMKVEVWHNFYLGYGIQTNYLLTNFTTSAPDPIYIPGFGKHKRNMSVGISYSVYYLIPYRKVVLKKKKKLDPIEPAPIEQNELEGTDPYENY